jgi:hypothetical protein
MTEPRDLLGKTMSCRQIDDLVIVVHDPQLAPDDAEWERYVKWCSGLLTRYPALKVLVLSGDKAPSAPQRSLYNREIAGERVHIAVLMTNRAVIMIVKIFAWFVGNIRAFEKDDLAGACAYLGIKPSDEIRKALSELRGNSAGSVRAS